MARKVIAAAVVVVVGVVAVDSKRKVAVRKQMVRATPAMSFGCLHSL